MVRILCLSAFLLAGASTAATAAEFGTAATAAEFGTAIEMRAKDGTTLYVPGVLPGFGAVDWMVDTGSGYTTINEQMLAVLQRERQVRFVKTLRGRLANGSELDVPVYAIDAIAIGDGCWLHDVEAAVFPGKTRAILGLNVLQRTGPFIFSFAPPRLVVSHCDRSTDAVAWNP